MPLTPAQLLRNFNEELSVIGRVSGKELRATRAAVREIADSRSIGDILGKIDQPGAVNLDKRELAQLRGAYDNFASAMAKDGVSSPNAVVYNFAQLAKKSMTGADAGRDMDEFMSQFIKALKLESNNNQVTARAARPAARVERPSAQAVTVSPVKGVSGSDFARFSQIPDARAAAMQLGGNKDALEKWRKVNNYVNRLEADSNSGITQAAPSLLERAASAGKSLRGLTYTAAVVAAAYAGVTNFDTITSGAERVLGSGEMATQSGAIVQKASNNQAAAVDLSLTDAFKQFADIPTNKGGKLLTTQEFNANASDATAILKKYYNNDKKLTAGEFQEAMRELGDKVGADTDIGKRIISGADALSQQVPSNTVLLGYRPPAPNGP